MKQGKKARLMLISILKEVTCIGKMTHYNYKRLTS